MRTTLLIFLAVLCSVSFSAASNHKEKKFDNTSYSEHEKRHDDLKSLLKEIKHEMRYKIRNQEATIDRQEELIDEMRFKIKELEYEQFQTTQSLRNLELEVWELKKTVNE